MAARSPATHTSRGRPTRYGMACGYVERFERDEQRVRLYQEHGTYHVVGFGYDYGFKRPDDQRTNALYGFRWTYRTLTDARLGFDIAKRWIRQTDPPRGP